MIAQPIEKKMNGKSHSRVSFQDIELPRLELKKKTTSESVLLGLSKNGTSKEGLRRANTSDQDELDWVIKMPQITPKCEISNDVAGRSYKTSEF